MGAERIAGRKSCTGQKAPLALRQALGCCDTLAQSRVSLPLLFTSRKSKQDRFQTNESVDGFLFEHEMIQGGVALAVADGGGHESTRTVA